MNKVALILACASVTSAWHLKEPEVPATSPTPAQRETYANFDRAFTFATTRDMYSVPYEYAWEPHEITTEDGYIITLFRLFKRDSPRPDNIVMYNFEVGFSETRLF